MNHCDLLNQWPGVCPLVPRAFCQARFTSCTVSPADSRNLFRYCRMGSWTLHQSPCADVLSAPYCSAKMIPSHGVRNDRIVSRLAFWCHPACLVQPMLFSTRNLSHTVNDI